VSDLQSQPQPQPPSPSSSPQPDKHDDELGFALPKPPAVTRTRAISFVAIGCVAVAAAFVIGYLPRRQARRELVETTGTGGAASGAPPRVELIAPKILASDRALALPATVTPLESTTLYPRTSGYVAKWLVDIGDKVTEGQVLAEIDSPDVDAQLLAARAGLVQAQAGVKQAIANAAKSKKDLDRYVSLQGQKLVADADLDQKTAQAEVDAANVDVAQANVAAADANVRRLAEMQSWEHVTAPFAGKITARLIDRGALVSAGNTTPLFKISSSDPARIFVQVPQDVVATIHAGIGAKITAREFPGRTFEGQVTRAAGELDPSLRTMTTEVRVPNGDGALVPGMYVTAELQLPAPHHVLEIPATALYNDSKGTRVAVVTDGKVTLAPIVIERDTGATIQIASGISEDAKVIKVAVPTLTDGSAVDVATP
jgi:RND family efflux transporter MFP subunit